MTSIIFDYCEINLKTKRVQANSFEETDLNINMLPHFDRSHQLEDDFLQVIQHA